MIKLKYSLTIFMLIEWIEMQEQLDLIFSYQMVWIITEIQLK